MSFNPLTNRMFASVEGSLVAQTSDGFLIEIDPHDYHGRILWLFGSNDWKVSRVVNGLLARGDIFLDIGANYGSIGLAAFKAVGRDGHVHWFEPQPMLASRIRGTMAESRHTNWTLHEIALFDNDGQMDLTVCDNHSGMASLVPDINGAPKDGSIKVPVRQASTYVGRLVGSHSFGVKIDIEGAEPEVLKDLLNFPGLRFVVFEGDRNQRTLYDLFLSRGFVIYGLCRTIIFPQVSMLNNFSDWQKYHDFLAIPKAVSLIGQGISLNALRAKLTESGAGVVRGSTSVASAG